MSLSLILPSRRHLVATSSHCSFVTSRARVMLHSQTMIVRPPRSSRNIPSAGWFLEAERVDGGGGRRLHRRRRSIQKRNTAVVDAASRLASPRREPCTIELELHSVEAFAEMPCLGTTLVDLLTGDASHTDTYLLLCDVLSLPLQWHSAVKHRGMEESEQGATWTSGRPEISSFALNMAPNRC